METSEQISVDLKAILQEGHRDFSLLNVYKGVPFVCKAILERVEGKLATFTVNCIETASLQTEKNTLILSDGLLEPLEATLVAADYQKGLFTFTQFIYAGSKFANRRELRVEPSMPLEVSLVGEENTILGELLDISVRGAGVSVAPQNRESRFTHGGQVCLNLTIPEGKLSLEGKIRNVVKSASSFRLAIEFMGSVPEKVPLIRYIMRRRAQIFAEVREIYEQRLKNP